MHHKTLVLTRGLPGSAKTTLARTIAPHANFAADDYFTDEDGVYHFDPSQIGEAHADCQRRTKLAMLRGESVIAVHNTFSMKWEAKPYFELAQDHGYTVFIVECQNNFGNEHGVPEQVIQRMKDRWEPLRGEPVSLKHLFKVRFWDWYFGQKRKLKKLLGK